MATTVYTHFAGMLQEGRNASVRTYASDDMGNTSYLLDSSGMMDRYYGLRSIPRNRLFSAIR